MTADELLDELQSSGFRMGEVASKRWRVGLVRSESGLTLVVLPRKNGVDVLLTPLPVNQLVNSQGRLSISMQREGDRFGEFFYEESETSVHQRVLEVAHSFVIDQKIGDSLFDKVGIGGKELLEKRAALARGDSGNGGSLRALYAGITSGDGEPVYLSDGVWLDAAGSLTDERH